MNKKAPESNLEACESLHMSTRDFKFWIAASWNLTESIRCDNLHIAQPRSSIFLQWQRNLNLIRYVTPSSPLCEIRIPSMVLMVAAHVAIITFHFPEAERNQPDQPLMAVSTTTGQAHTCNLQAFAPTSVSEKLLNNVAVWNCKTTYLTWKIGESRHERNVLKGIHLICGRKRFWFNKRVKGNPKCRSRSRFCCLRFGREPFLLRLARSPETAD